MAHKAVNPRFWISTRMTQKIAISKLWKAFQTSFFVCLFQIKCKNRWSDQSFTDLLALLNEAFPWWKWNAFESVWVTKDDNKHQPKVSQDPCLPEGMYLTSKRVRTAKNALNALWNYASLKKVQTLWMSPLRDIDNCICVKRQQKKWNGIMQLLVKTERWVIHETPCHTEF